MTDPQLPPPVPRAPYPPLAPQAGQPASPYPPGQHAPASAPPPGFSAPPSPTYAPPPGAYAAGPAGYQSVAGPYTPPPSPRGPSAVGIWALVLALAALLIPSVIGAVSGYAIGFGLAESGALDYLDGDIDSLAFLAPVREQVLWAEIAFWLGTVLGVWAIVQGIVAISRRRGRGQGIACLLYTSDAADECSV